MKQVLVLALALAISSTAYAGNNNGPDYGSGDSSATANANGGSAHAGASAGAVSSSSVGDVTNVAAGGQGGRGGDGGNALSISEGGKGGNGYATGGDAKQAQSLDAKQSTAVSQGLSSTIGATGSGNSTAVGGQSTNIKFEDVANAPPVFLGNVSATMSCAGGFNAGGSSQDGAGALGFTWVSGDCRSVVAADKFRELGMVDTACKILKTTKGYKRAAKADPSLNDVSCTIAK